ncbi:hypothetical protein [Corallococcus exercitus]|uniref:hypothetical protein n=1 Tax=Corallococcus exercitus TaxID=2316736 RepID=UPI001ABFBDDB|nr:hypothetical protein [Corallococcus exercitus]
MADPTESRQRFRIPTLTGYRFEEVSMELHNGWWVWAAKGIYVLKYFGEFRLSIQKSIQPKQCKSKISTSQRKA